MLWAAHRGRGCRQNGMGAEYDPRGTQRAAVCAPPQGLGTSPVDSCTASAKHVRSVPSLQGLLSHYAGAGCVTRCLGRVIIQVAVMCADLPEAVTEADQPRHDQCAVQCHRHCKAHDQLHSSHTKWFHSPLTRIIILVLDFPLSAHAQPHKPQEIVRKARVLACDTWGKAGPGTWSS